MPWSAVTYMLIGAYLVGIVLTLDERNWAACQSRAEKAGLLLSVVLWPLTWLVVWSLLVAVGICVWLRTRRPK